ncbi:unnamed protein product [Phytophthora fragariaefolia]|uniref:Unnamed protein product n=1 Tax=Phytophthora fragariaefolia TaxID=1490495 RepID=A0A9W6U5X9_9STRA|nr:unnamed protein product [Phytophthora fragariaefolia]
MNKHVWATTTRKRGHKQTFLVGCKRTGEISHTQEAMAPDLRVRAVLRPPRQGKASDSEEAVDSDEEWADSAEEAVESGEEESGTGSSSPKQRWSEACGHLQSTQIGEQPVVLGPPLETIEFATWDSLEVYLKDYSTETYQVRLAFWAR